MPTKDKEKAKSPSAASNEAILAAVTKQGGELAKVSKLVDGLKKSMEDRLDTIESHLSTLQNEHQEVERRVGEIDEGLSSVDQRIEALEATCTELREANIRLSAKLNDLEGRSRRLNIRIIGIEEGEEGARPTEFISKLIPELLGQDNFSKRVKVDRAHRSLKEKPKPNERPRPFIAKLHNESDVRDILRLCREKGTLKYNDEKVSIFPDYTAEVVNQRKAFKNVKIRLIDAGAKCNLRFPAKLHVVYGAITKEFATPAAAERFADHLPPLVLDPVEEIDDT